MPLPLAPTIAAGAHLVGGILTNNSQAKQDHKNRKWQEHMYQVTRQDSLTDWHMQNAYNSPAAQMQRMKAAGLNPNLVYGNGADATANQAPRAADPGSYHPNERNYGFIGSAAEAGIMSYYDTQLKQAQVDNLAAQKEVMNQDRLLKAAQTIATTVNAGLSDVSTQQKKFDLEMANQLKETTVQAAITGVKKQQADLQYTLDNNERAALQNNMSLKEAAERILTMRLERGLTEANKKHVLQQIENLKKDGNIKQLDIDLKKLGLQPSDALWQRILGRIINGVAEGFNTDTPRSKGEALGHGLKKMLTDGPLWWMPK